MAGPRCTICDHAQRIEIDALYCSESLRNIAKRFDVGPSAVLRHKNQCLSGAVARASAISKQKLGEDLLEYLRDSIKELKKISEKALGANDFRAAVAAITERTNTTLTTWQLLNPEPKQSSESPKARYILEEPLTVTSDTDRSPADHSPANVNSTTYEHDIKGSRVQ